MRRNRIRTSVPHFGMSLTITLLGVSLASAQSQSAGQVLPGGSIALPSGPPPTGMSKSVPAPMGNLSPSVHPLKTSLSARQLAQMVNGRALTIDDVVGIALSTNRDYATAIANLDRARGVKNEAKSQLNPQAGLSGTIEEYDQNTTINFVGQSILQINQFNPVYAAQVTLPLDLLGSIRAAVSQAQFNEVAARIDVNRARNNLVFSVRNAFFQALRAKGQFAVATDNLDNAKTRLSDAQKGMAAGLSSRFDVITAQRDVADAQQALVNSRAQVTLVLGQLKSTVGIDVSAPIKISDAGAVEIPPGVMPVEIPSPSANRSSEDAGAFSRPGSTAPVVGPQSVVPMPPAVTTTVDVHSAEDLTDLGPEFKQVVDEAVRNRPEVLESDAQISAAQRGVVYAKRSLLPSFGLQLQYVYQPDATVFVRAHQAVATLSLNVPLYDGGLGAARQQEAKAVLASAETAKRSAVDQVTFDVQQAYVSLVEARDRVQVAEAEVAQAKEAFRLARVRYSAGVSQTPTVSPQLELSNAESALTAAETNRLNALYDYNVARAQLDRAAGRYSYGAGAGFGQAPSGKVTGQGPS